MGRRRRGTSTPHKCPTSTAVSASISGARCRYSRRLGSLLGPPVLHVDTPDEGNMHTIEMVGSKAQEEEEEEEKWMAPLIEGDYSLAYSVTEPMQGASRTQI